MHNVEIVQRVRAVMQQMRMLSESAAVRLDGDRVSGGGAKSAPPPGVRFGGRDLRDLSLADYWEQRFQSVRGDVARMEVFVLLAERDLSRARRRQPAPDPHETREAREERVLLQYEGLSPLEAALVEDTSENWIRAVRVRKKRDPATGFVQPAP